MDPVSRLNQVVLLLRRQLLERARRDPTPATVDQANEGITFDAPPAATGADPLAHIAGMRKSGVRDERVLSRLLIEDLLTRELGTSFINDAGFQRVVEAVLESIELDPLLAQTLHEAVRS